MVSLNTSNDKLLNLVNNSKTNVSYIINTHTNGNIDNGNDVQ